MSSGLNCLGRTLNRHFRAQYETYTLGDPTFFQMHEDYQEGPTMNAPEQVFGPVSRSQQQPTLFSAGWTRLAMLCKEIQMQIQIEKEMCIFTTQELAQFRVKIKSNFVEVK